MASINEAALKVLMDKMYDLISQETDVKINALNQLMFAKVNDMESDYNTKIVDTKQAATVEVSDLKAVTKKAYEQHEDSVANIEQNLSSIEVRLKESMGSKVFTEKSIQFTDIVDKALIQQKLSTDTLKEDAKVEFLKYQEIWKDIEKRVGE